MRSLAGNVKGGQGAADLAKVATASVGFATVLTFTMVGDGPTLFAQLGLRHLLVLAVLSGAFFAALYLVLSAVRSTRRIERTAHKETTELRRLLTATEAILKAEQQILVFWDQNQGPQIAINSLQGIAGVPGEAGELLKYGQWLTEASAQELRTALEALFRDGRPFNKVLKTRAGTHLETDGRTAGGRAILKLRDAAGYKQDLARILDQHRMLDNDIRICRRMLDSMPNPAWIRGKDGRLEWVNAAYLKAVEGASEAEVINRQIEFLETRQRQTIDATLAGGEVFKDCLPIVIGGERRAHEIIALPFDGASAAIAVDVAALETARGELDRQVAAYDRTLDRVATAVAIFSPDQRLSFFNEAYHKLWKLDADWLQTRPSDGEILDRLRELRRLPEVVNYRDWKSKALACYKTGAPQDSWWHLADGRTLHVMAEQRPDGGVTYLYDDRSKWLALESRFNALISVQRETLDHLKEGVAVLAPDGRLKLYNAAFAQIWRLSRRMLEEGPHIDEIIGQCQVLYDDKRTWTRINRSVTAISDRRQPAEGQMLRPDDSAVDYACLPLPDGNTLLSFADVTDRKRAERALIERNEALEAADKLKSAFISHISYELRTPLTNIIGFSELLASPRTGAINPKQREYLGDISASSRTLQAIINDILDLATIDAGGLELKLATVRVGSIIEQAAMGVRERITRARLNLAITVAEDAVELVCDESRVRQVLYNLLSNAIGFSEPGDAIKLDCWREAGMVAFRIEDEGAGIPKEHQHKVFERFESRTQGGGSRHRGAGLGLSIVKSLVELHGGSMTLASEPGQGTVVTVRLPEGGIEKAEREADAAFLLQAQAPSKVRA